MKKIIGSLEVITGPMFSGKTEELIRRIKRANIAGQHTIVFKPKLDDRYSEDCVVSHSGHTLSSFVLEYIEQAYDYLISVERVDVVGIDEAQFFGDTLYEFVINALQLSNLSKIIIAGLDMDWRGEPWEPMGKLMCIAHRVDKLRSVCKVCYSDNAIYTQRISDNKEQIQVGDSNFYEARCSKCYVPPTK